MQKSEFLKTIRHLEFNDEGKLVKVYGIIRNDRPKPSDESVFDWLGIERI